MSPKPADGMPFELNIPAPLPAELGQLAPTVDWWLRAHDVLTPNAAPFAEPAVTLRLEACSDPELLPTAAALCALLTNADAAAVTEVDLNDEGLLDHAAWMHQCALIRDQLWQLRPHRSEPNELLDAVPTEFKEITDRLIDSESDCVVVDGPVTAACVLLAYEVNPDSLSRIRPVHLGQSPVESRTWQHLRVGPILPIQTGYHDGQLLPAAVALINLALELSVGPPTTDDTADADS